MKVAFEAVESRCLSKFILHRVPCSSLIYLLTLNVSDSYYEDIQKMPAVSEQDMNSFLKEESQVFTVFIIIVKFVFDRTNATHYVIKQNLFYKRLAVGSHE